jgi:site-specific recombinase XerD
MRRNLSSFYRWLEDENYIFKSPLRRIHKIKTRKVVKEPFTDEEIERLRDGCKYPRDLVIIEFLYSTGVRIGELCKLNRSDIDFEERECIVLGKGDKERVTYFDARTKLHLIEYLKSRDDNNPALFVSIRKPATRLEEGGVEAMLRKLGERCNVTRCHPHRWRRTCASAALSKGMPIEQVQKMLGHEEISTTLTYLMITDSTVKSSHRKYLG